MELREFKKWLIDNKIENDELYEESIKCYQVGAYRAAYIFSYLANHKNIAKLAIDYRGVPVNFEVKCPLDDAKESKWNEIVDLLQDEDKWEQTVNDKLIKPSEGNIFKLPSKIKEKCSHMRVLRNNSAHAKDRRVSESTVLELWSDIEYIYPYFVINGTKEAWLKEFDDMVKYAKSDVEMEEKLFDKFYPLNKQMKIEISKEILDKYIIQKEWYEDVPRIAISFFNQLREFDTDKDIFSSLTNEEGIYLQIVVGEIPPNFSEIEYFGLLDKNIDKNSFLDICEDNPQNFWKLIDNIFLKADAQKLSEIVIKYLKKVPDLLDGVEAYDNSIFLIKCEEFYKFVMEKISHLYYYRKSSTGQRRHDTDTFDYSRYHNYSCYIGYVFYTISKFDKRQNMDQSQNFIKRVATILNKRYSVDSEEYDIQQEIKEYNSQFNIYEM